MDISAWVWVLIALLVVIVIVVAVVMSRGKSEVRNREKADELRARAANDGEFLESRQERTETIEAQAEAARQRAMTESARADSLREQAGESDEQAARAAEKAEILDDEATHSRESFEEAVEEHDQILREADRRDPDVDTDRHGNRVPDADEEVDVIVIPEEERLDIGDDYSGDEFDEPEAEYIDPAEHDRLDHMHEDPPIHVEPVAEVPQHQNAVDGSAHADDAQATGVDSPVQARRMEYSPSEDTLEDESAPQLLPEADAPAVDPYGNPVLEDEPASTGSTTYEDDVPRDEQGRRLDPYGNPVAEDRDFQ